MPQKPTACLALADGTVFYGQGFGATGEVVAELVFNTAMTGYLVADPRFIAEARALRGMALRHPPGHMQRHAQPGGFGQFKGRQRQPAIRQVGHGKDVVVIGGGNSAVEEALYLSNLARHVTVIHRRGEFKAERILQDRLFKKENISVMWDTVVDEIVGVPGKLPLPPSVNGLRLRDTRSGEVSELPIDGVFVAIGHAPAVELFAGKLKQKPNGYLWTAPDSTRTDVPGVFAAGDVTDDVYRQAVTAAGLGCMAALEAEKYLAEMEVHREAAE